MAKFTTKLVLDQRRPNIGKRYQQLLRLTVNSVQKYLPTGKRITLKEWQKPTKHEAKEIFSDLRSLETKLRAIMKQLRVFNYEKVKSDFQNQEGTDTLKSHFDNHLKRLWDNDQVKSHGSYLCALQSFERFEAGMRLIAITA